MPNRSAERSTPMIGIYDLHDPTLTPSVLAAFLIALRISRSIPRIIHRLSSAMARSFRIVEL